MLCIFLGFGFVASVLAATRQGVYLDDTSIEGGMPIELEISSPGGNLDFETSMSRCANATLNDNYRAYELVYRQGRYGNTATCNYGHQGLTPWPTYIDTAFQALKCHNIIAGCSEASDFTALPKYTYATNEGKRIEPGQLSILGLLWSPNTFDRCMARIEKHNRNARPEHTLTYFEWGAPKSRCIGYTRSSPNSTTLRKVVGLLVSGIDNLTIGDPFEQEWLQEHVIDLDCTSAHVSSKAYERCQEFKYNTSFPVLDLAGRGSHKPYDHKVKEVITATVPHSSIKGSFKVASRMKGIIIDHSRVEGSATSTKQYFDGTAATQACAELALSKNAPSFNLVYRKTGWTCVTLPEIVRDLSGDITIDDSVIDSYIYRACREK